MGAYVVRRLVQAVFTIFGVMLLTFLLFRVVAGEIASAHLGPRATAKQLAEWRAKHGYDKPLLINRNAGASWYDTQFLSYMTRVPVFQARSVITNEKLLAIIVERAPYSLAITVPAMALGWVLAMIIATIVAYYRASLIDHVGVFLAVLGMCVPYLAFIMAGQMLMFRIAPRLAYGLASPFSIYVPVAIAVIAGLGGSVRFYRTVIVDEANRDYVRTARAKGVPLPGVMFKHILRNCMLPILTNLVLAIPFLIMGSLLLETFFGIPGLGDLLLSSITNRDEPIVSGLTYLTALTYTLGVLLTDVLYAVFDPRVQLT